MCFDKHCHGGCHKEWRTSLCTTCTSMPKVVCTRENVLLPACQTQLSHVVWASMSEMSAFNVPASGIMMNRQQACEKHITIGPDTRLNKKTVIGCMTAPWITVSLTCLIPRRHPAMRKQKTCVLPRLSGLSGSGKTKGHEPCLFFIYPHRGTVLA